MFKGTDASGNTLYVTKIYDALRYGIEHWDTFGNCEHVHYTYNELVNMLTNLQGNLSGWSDFYGEQLLYSDIRKVSVVIGGPTENTKETNGGGCVLPWGTFNSKKIDSVYSIRVNDGTPKSDAVLPIISWLDYSDNNTGKPYTATNGSTCFTDKYVATTRAAVLNALKDIAMREMTQHGLDVRAEDKFVDDLTITDTVTDEFMLQPDQPIVAIVYNKDGTVEFTTEIDRTTGEVTFTGEDGIPVTITGTISVSGDTLPKTTVITFDEEQTVHYLKDNETKTEYVTNPQKLTIVENADKTTKITYDFGKVYNTKKVKLHFDIEAKEDYIGSNNVFTNIGTPGFTYTHQKLDRDNNPDGDPIPYSVACTDTPEVNVPILFTTVDGASIVVRKNTEVDLATLDSEDIVEDALKKIDNYDQTNGVLSFRWILPDGSTVVIPTTIPVTNGVPDWDPALVGSGDVLSTDAIRDMFKELFTADVAKDYKATLEVTFTPNAVKDKGNFANDTTRTAVNERTHGGIVKIKAVEMKTDLTVLKEWTPAPPNTNTQVKFIVLAAPDDGSGTRYLYDTGNTTDRYVLSDTATTYTITAADSWRMDFPDIPNAEFFNTTNPVTGLPEEDVRLYTYSVLETNLEDDFPDYTVSYREGEAYDYAGSISVTVQMKENKNLDNKKLKINCKVDGVPVTLTTANKVSIAKSGSTTLTFALPAGVTVSANSAVEFAATDGIIVLKDDETKDDGLSKNIDVEKSKISVKLTRIEGSVKPALTIQTTVPSNSVWKTPNRTPKQARMSVFTRKPNPISPTTTGAWKTSLS